MLCLKKEGIRNKYDIFLNHLRNWCFWYIINYKLYTTDHIKHIKYITFHIFMYMYIKVDNLEIDWRRAKNGDLFFFLQMSLFFPQEVLIFFQKSRVVWNNRIGIIFCSDRTKTNLPKVVNANTARIHENLILLGNLQKKSDLKKTKPQWFS